MMDTYKDKTSYDDTNPYKRITLFDGRMLMEFPAEWDDMPAERVSRVFCMAEKPHSIKSNLDGSRFISLTLSDKTISNHMVRTAIREISYTVESVYPFIAPVKIRAGIRKAQVVRYGWFSFKMPAADGEIYTTMFATPINGRLLIGSCGCSFEDKDAEDVFQHCISSIMSINADHE